MVISCTDACKNAASFVNSGVALYIVRQLQIHGMLDCGLVDTWLMTS